MLTASLLLGGVSSVDAVQSGAGLEDTARTAELQGGGGCDCSCGVTEWLLTLYRKTQTALGTTGFMKLNNVF